LLSYPFPGNVRQLRNMVEQAMILARGKLLSADRFQMPLRSQHSRKSQEIATQDLSLDVRLAHVREQEEALWKSERAIIESALEQVNGNKSHAAQVLGISRYALQRRLKRMS